MHLNKKNLIMLKKSIIVCAALFAMACSKVKNGYFVKASTDDITDSTKVFLNKVENNKLSPIDTTTIINNEFAFEGTIDSPDVYFISIENVRNNLPFILENEAIDITLYKDSINASAITGSKENDLLQEYSRTVKAIGKETEKLRNLYREALTAKDSLRIGDLKLEYEDLVKEGSDYDLDFIKENNSSLMGMFILERNIKNKNRTVKELNTLFESAPEHLKQSRPGKNISQSLNAMLATAIGSVAPDFSAPTPNGDMLALNDVKGKITILDFWAAWCGPCRRENPNIVKVYNQYHDKGLEIIGVSLDGTGRQQDPKAAWLKAIEDDKLTWHQVSNLQYFNDPIAKAYNITSIPATFILDAEGKIIAKNLRGQALDDKIAELLN